MNGWQQNWRESWGLPLAVLATENVGFFLLAFFAMSQRPAQEYQPFAIFALLLAWMMIPPLSAALFAVNRRRWGRAAVLGGLLSCALWGCLAFVRYVATGDEDQETAGLLTLAIGFGLMLTLSVIIALACAGFVGSIVTRLDAAAGANRKALVLIGLKKGLAFGGVCALTASALYFALAPATSARGAQARIDRRAAAMRRRNESVMAFALGTLGAGLVGGLAGYVYQPRPCLEKTSDT
jgi:hypothetical protein